MVNSKVLTKHFFINVLAMILVSISFLLIPTNNGKSSSLTTLVYFVLFNVLSISLLVYNFIDKESYIKLKKHHFYLSLVVFGLIVLNLVTLFYSFINIKHLQGLTDMGLLGFALNYGKAGHVYIFNLPTIAIYVILAITLYECVLGKDSKNTNKARLQKFIFSLLIYFTLLSFFNYQTQSFNLILVLEAIFVYTPLIVVFVVSLVDRGQNKKIILATYIPTFVLLLLPIVEIALITKTFPVVPNFAITNDQTYQIASSFTPITFNVNQFKFDELTKTWQKINVTPIINFALIYVIFFTVILGMLTKKSYSNMIVPVYPSEKTASKHFFKKTKQKSGPTFSNKQTRR